MLTIRKDGNVSSIFSKIAEFNRKIIGYNPPKTATIINSDVMRWNVAALTEEVSELAGATTVEDQADALVGLIYFAAGMLYKMGVDGERAFNLVHDANMQKERGQLSKRPAPKAFYDATKPAGWKAPDLATAMRPKALKLLITGPCPIFTHSAATILASYGLKFSGTQHEYVFKRAIEPVISRLISDRDATNMADIKKLAMENPYIVSNAIKSYLRDNQTRIAKSILEEEDIYTELNNQLEFVELLKSGLIDKTIWIGSLTSLTTAPIPIEMADHVIKINANKPLANQIILEAQKLVKALNLEE